LFTPRLQQIEQQNDGKSDAEGCGENAYWLRSQRIFESVSKQIRANK
jgi:hypothetical protein